MKKILTAMALAGSLMAGNFINLDITNDTIMVEAQGNIVSDQPFYARGGYLINSDKPNFFYLGLKSEGQILGVDLPVTFSMFVDYVHTDDNSALPIGVGAFGFLNSFSVPVFVRGEAEYAPEILSFQSAERFFKVKAEAGAKFIENGEVFAGYRSINFDHNYDNSLYFGIGFTF